MILTGKVALVSGAGGGTVLETSVTEWERVLAVNLTGSFLLSREYCLG